MTIDNFTVAVRDPEGHQSGGAVSRRRSRPGRPLDPGVRRLLEASLGEDLSEVHVVGHPQADRWCHVWGASGLAVGGTVVLRTDVARAGERAWLWLLAHEVAHLVQQRRGPVQARPVGGGWAVGLAGGAQEREADAAADAVLAGRAHPFAVPPECGAATDGAARHGRPVRVVQLHDTASHNLIGTWWPWQLALLGSDSKQDQATLRALINLMWEWSHGPEDFSREHIERLVPGLRTAVVPTGSGSGKGVLMTLGELNTLADYVPNPRAIMECPQSELLGMLQTIRYRTHADLSELAGLPPREARYPESAVRHWFPHRVQQLHMARLVNAGLGNGEDHQTQLLCRNAAHFAPHSWWRWAHYHNMALDYARTSATLTGSRGEELAELAKLYHGYADHFLQDSFAAGHVVDKTKIMQVAAETLLDLGVYPKGGDDHRALATMVRSKQPNLAGDQLFAPYRSDVLANDPQTAEEEGGSFAERLRLLGVRSEPHNATRMFAHYVRFLGNPALQAATAAVHDTLNKWTVHLAGNRWGPFQFGGDFSLAQPGDGLSVLAVTKSMSDTAFEDALGGRDPRFPTASIFDRFPNQVQTRRERLSLGAWQERHIAPLVRRHTVPGAISNLARLERGVPRHLLGLDNVMRGGAAALEAASPARSKALTVWKDRAKDLAAKAASGLQPIATRVAPRWRQGGKLGSAKQTPLPAGRHKDPQRRSTPER